MFDTDRFVADCRGAAATSGSSGVLDVVSRAVNAPREILEDLGEPRRAGVQVLHRSTELTVFNLIWGPQMCQLPHDHRIWTVIGIYTGREDNIFWRRPAGNPKGRIEAAGAKALSEREAVPVGPDIIHSVINPVSRLTGAIHEEEIRNSLGAMVRERPDALLVLADRLLLHHRALIMDFAMRHRLPGVHAYRKLVEAGGLMSYGPNYADMHRRAAYFVDRILKGAKPGDLPVERPPTFELAVNLKAAKALGLTIPPSVLLGATEIIP